MKAQIVMVDLERIPLSLASFWQPEYIPPSAWTMHAPFAFWLTERLRPRVFVELGTHFGLSYFSFCQAIRQLDFKTTAFAIDSWEGDEHAGFYGEEVFAAVASYNARYAAFSSLLRGRFEDKLSYFEDGSIDLLHIDGRHAYEDVQRDFEEWMPKLSHDAVVLFHDTNVRERDFGVWRFFGELKAQHPTFEFVHGHGLGVACPKDVVPNGLQHLVQLDAEGAAWTNRAYAALGQSVANLQVQTSLQVHLRNLAGEARGTLDFRAITSSALSEEIGRLSASLAQLREEHSSLRLELATAEAGRLAAESTLHGTRDALSGETTSLRSSLVLAEAGRLMAEDRYRTAAALLERSRAEVEALRASNGALVRQMDERNAAVAAQVGAAIRELCAPRRKSITLALRKPGQRWTKLIEDARTVDRFLENLEWFRVGAPMPAKRPDRVLAHLAFADFPLVDLPLFDAQLYRLQDAALNNLNHPAILHYATLGIAEKRNIHPLMDTLSYERSYGDAAALGMTPLEHFVNIGSDKGYDPHVLFDTDWYKSRYPHIKKTGINPLADYLKNPNNQPHPLFDSAYYIDNNPDVAATGINPLTHFVLFGANEDRNPNPMFDVAFYKANNTVVAENGLNPLVHFIMNGADEGRDPHPDFSMTFYAETNPDVVATGVNLLIHYLELGRRAGS